MLTVSLHGIRIHATRGMYAEEQKLHNEFEADVDISVPSGETKEFPFIDYTIIRRVVAEAFGQPHHLIEQFISEIHAQLSEIFPEARNIRISIRKLNPPMPGQVGYAQVTFDNE